MKPVKCSTTCVNLFGILRCTGQSHDTKVSTNILGRYKKSEKEGDCARVSLAYNIFFSFSLRLCKYSSFGLLYWSFSETVYSIVPSI